MYGRVASRQAGYSVSPNSGFYDHTGYESLPQSLQYNVGLIPDVSSDVKNLSFSLKQRIPQSDYKSKFAEMYRQNNMNF